VFTDEFVCVVAAGNPRALGGSLTLADLAEMRHAVARFAPGQGASLTPADQALARAGVHRQVEAAVQGLLAVPFAVSGTDLCAFVPRRLATRCADVLDLAIVRTPLEPAQLVETAHWHPAQSGDPALRWLRTALHEVAVRLES
jgi:DNA-binding transcriptional LysR family regulator